MTGHIGGAAPKTSVPRGVEWYAFFLSEVMLFFRLGLSICFVKMGSMLYYVGHIPIASLMGKVAVCAIGRRSGIYGAGANIQTSIPKAGIGQTASPLADTQMTSGCAVASRVSRAQRDTAAASTHRTNL